MNNIELFKELARAVYKVSKEQNRIKIITHRDYHSLAIGNTLSGLKIEMCFKNLEFFAVKEETKQFINNLKLEFKEAELFNYKLMSLNRAERNEDYEEAYINKTFALITGKIEDILSLQEASEMWGLNDSTLRKAIANNKFEEDEYRKTGRNYIIKKSAMIRVYGEIKTSKTGEK